MRRSAIQALWRAALTLGAARRSGKALPPLLFFTDPIRTPRPERVIALLPRGAGVVFRAFGAPDAEARGRALARQARRRGLVFLVGADPGLAVRLAADGVHLPQSLARRAGAIATLRQRFLITAAAHDLPAALAARRAGIDAIVVSPIFASASPSAGRPLGPRALAVLIRRAGVPTYALGGVNALTVRKLNHTGVSGVAAIGGLIGREAHAPREAKGPKT